MFFDIGGPFIWFGLAFLFGAVELATTSLVSIWFFAGALAALLVSLVVDSIVIELGVFIVVTAVTLIFTRPILVDKMLKKTPTNADMLIGKTATVTETITAQDHGRAKIDGLIWRATAHETINKGEICVVAKIEGVTLIVQKQKVQVG